MDALDTNSSTLFAFLCKLYELTHGRICVIMISQLAWQDVHHVCKKNIGISGLPFYIEFPPLSKNQMMEMIKEECPTDDVDFYLSFASIVYDTYQRPCRNLNEIKYLISILYPKYIEPIQQGKGIHSTKTDENSNQTTD